MRPNSVAIPVAVDDGLRRPAHDVRAREDEPLRLDRARLAGQRRVVDPQLVSRDDLGVRADAVARHEEDDVAGNELLRRDLALLSVATHACGLREHSAQRLARSLGPVLLREREDGVHEDHHDDRRGELWQAADERQRRSEPEE